MLKNLDPVLSPDLLFVLRGMGHGDEIAIVDANYPVEEHGQRVVRLDGVNLIRVLDAVLSVLPIDDFTEHAIFRSTVKGNVDELNAIHDAIVKTCKVYQPDLDVVPLDGDVFYDQVREAHCVIATSEPSLYANVILRKGVIYP